MARKKRTIINAEDLPPDDKKNKKVYRDNFQQNFGRKLEDVGSRFEGNGRNIIYGLVALVVLVALVGIYFAWNRRADAAAQTALGKAIETSTAVVSNSPQPADSTIKSFKTDKERAEAAINDFQAVADKFGNPYREKARYFIAVNKLSIDRAAAVGELTDLAQSNDEVGTLSKFALAQANTDDGKYDEAAKLYQELAAMDKPILAKDSINYELANVYVKQGKTAEAADLYFNIAKSAAEAKDAEGKAIPESETARKAKDELEKINPDKAKELPKPETDTPPSPFG